jgi:protease I
MRGISLTFYHFDHTIITVLIFTTPVTRGFIMANILFILMPNHKPEEFNVPHKMLIDAGHTVDVAGLEASQPEPNLMLADLTSDHFNKYDALVIPGGPGSKKYLWNNKAIQDVINYFHEQRKIIAAICYAVIVVVQTGILLNKHATVYATDEAKAILEENGVRFSKGGCVSLAPEKIITAQGPPNAQEFGQAILDMLGH